LQPVQDRHGRRHRHLAQVLQVRLAHHHDGSHRQSIRQNHCANDHRGSLPCPLDPGRFAPFWPDQVKKESRTEHGRYGNTDKNVV